MKGFKLHKVVAFLIAIMMISLSFTMQSAVIAAGVLGTPSNLVLNRGNVPELAFGGPIGLSWAEVANRDTFTVYAFRDQGEANPMEAYAIVDNIDALHLDVNEAFTGSLSDGPFWFRVQAVADPLTAFEDSLLSAPIGPFWNTIHSDLFANDAAGSCAVFNNPNIPVLVIDTRRLVERQEQGHVVGDVHVTWPNALAVEAGFTHASYQAGVLAAWQNFIDNDLTDAQRATLNPALGYRDIHIFVY